MMTNQLSGMPPTTAPATSFPAPGEKKKKKKKEEFGGDWISFKWEREVNCILKPKMQTVVLALMSICMVLP